VYQHDPPGASGLDAADQEPFRKFAGAELEDFLFAKALECFEYDWSTADTQDRVSDWHILKARAGAFLDDAEVEAIVERAAKVEKIAHTNAIDLDSHRALKSKRRAKKLQLIEKGEYYA
jgi:hypothetical protein